MTHAQATPVSAGERVEEMDVLRGVALFGVFLMNLTGFASAGLMATEQQVLSLPTAALDNATHELLGWLVENKANTLFAFLFGLGFYLQMQRLEGRGADFERIYRRRLTVLLVMGLIHLVFFWAWDILHLYALAGFALLGMRRLSDRALLVGGLLLALFSLTVHECVVGFVGEGIKQGWPDPYADAAVLARQQVSIAGDYPGLIRVFAEYAWVDYLLNGLLLGWFLYALGRFMLGAWVGRHGWLQRANDYLPGFRRVMRVTIPAGLILSGIATLVHVHDDGGRLPEWADWEFVSEALHLLSVPVLATGYLCAIVVGLHTPVGRRLLAPFAYAGRMALTNYVTQTFFMAFVLFGVGPGLALAGHIGTTAALGIVVVAYAVQVWFSRWWLARFRYGPLEWIWRALTYGARPAMRVSAVVKQPT